MRNWPRQHINLLALILLFIIGTACVVFFLIWPRADIVSEKSRDLADKRAVLTKTKWPLDQHRLRTLLDAKEAKLSGKSASGSTSVGLKAQSKQVLEESTAMYDERIKQFFQSPADFVTDISRLDFQEEFTKLDQFLNSKGICVSEDVTGLGENTEAEKMYHLLLQTWTLDEMAKLVTKSGLRIGRHDTIAVKLETGQKRKAALIRVMPIRPIKLYPEDKEPYLLEVPVRMTLEGNVKELFSLLSALHANGVFLPVSLLQIYSEPSVKQAGTNLDFKAERLKIELECCGFFKVPSQKLPSRRQKTQIKRPPAGA